MRFHVDVVRGGWGIRIVLELEMLMGKNQR
jgi:hypothetical protein